MYYKACRCLGEFSHKWHLADCFILISNKSVLASKSEKRRKLSGIKLGILPQDSESVRTILEKTKNSNIVYTGTQYFQDVQYHVWKEPKILSLNTIRLCSHCI